MAHSSGRFIPALGADWLTPLYDTVVRFTGERAFKRRLVATARIPYQVPSLADLPDRLDSVLRVVYLVFNEGYSASSGGSLTRHDLSGEAIRLGRLLTELLPEPEALGLLALMLLQESRRAGAARRPGPLALEPGADCEGIGAGGADAPLAPARSVHTASGTRRGARQRARRRGDGLGPDCRTV